MLLRPAVEKAAGQIADIIRSFEPADRVYVIKELLRNASFADALAQADLRK